MITINPWRSTKCAGCRRQPLRSLKSGPNKPTASAANQRSGRSVPWTKPAATIRAAPERAKGAIRRIAANRSRSSRAPSAYSVRCMTFTIRNATPNTTP
jgi:hypothetical protein